MHLGEWIKKYRKEHGISMQKMAEMTDFSKAYIGMLEKGINPSTGKEISPTMQTFNKIAIGVGMDVNDLIQALDGDQPVTIAPAPSELEYTDEEKGIIRGYRKAPDNLKQVVKLTLQPYMVEAAAVAIPEKVEAAAVAVAIPEKAKTIIDFLKPFGVDCEYWDEAPDGESGDFIAMTILLTKFQGKDGYPHSSNKCWQYLEGLYKELKPAMDASDAERKKLIDKFIADTFRIDIAIAEGLSYRDKSTLLNVSKEVASKYHGVIDEDGNPRLERITSKETPADSKPADKKEAEG